MKKIIALLLVVFVILAGCTKTADDEISVTYVESQGEIRQYKTIEDLVNAAPCIFEGTVVDIFFRVKYYDDNPNHYNLWTIYEVEVTDSYKGNVGTKEYVAMQFGIRDFMVSEQVQAQRDAGIEDPTQIRVTKYAVFEIGSSYLFLADDDFYEDYIMGITPIQSAINDDPNLNFFAPYFTPEEIIAYLQENPATE